MENTLFVTAEIVAKDLGVSKPFAYKLVRQMNDELNAKGYLTVAGRVSRKYYEERFSILWIERRLSDGSIQRYGEKYMVCGILLPGLAR